MSSNIAYRAVFLAWLFIGTSSTGFCGEEPAKADSTGESKVSFYSQIRLIFQAHCNGCHQPAKPEGEYVMTSFAKLLAAGESEEPAIVPFKPNQSNLVTLILPEDGEAEMPKEKKPLADGEVALITKWIAQGAVDDTPDSAKLRYDMENPPVYMLPPVITSLDFSPDGKLLAVAGFHEVLLHTANGSEIVARLVGMSERIESVRFSPDGKLLAVTGGLPARMGEVQVWDVEKHELKLSLPMTFDTVHGASWSPDGKLISFGCADNTVRAIDAKTGKQVLYQGAHNDWVLDTVFSVKGTHLISVGRDRSAKLTDVRTQRFIDNITSITPRALQGGIAAIDRHPTRDEILVGGVDGEPKLYRIFRTSKRVIGDDANLIRKFPRLKGRIFGVAISRDGRRIAAGSCLDRTGEVRVCEYDFDTSLPKELQKIMEKRSDQRSPQEQQQLAKYWTEGVKVLAETTIGQAGVFSVAFSADGTIVAAAGSDGIVRLIDALTGSVVKEFVSVPVDSMMDVAEKKGGRQPVATPFTTKPKESPTGESLPEGEKLAAIEVQPTNFKISRRYDTVQFVVTGRMESGDVVDVTRLVKVETSSGAVGISPTGLVRARSNGKAELTFSLGGKTAKAVMEVAGVKPDFDVDLVRDVMPVFGKTGCNAGICHGSKKGKGGLKTSLRGNDPVYELRAYTDELASRRLNLASPENSLMLLKAAASVPHEGGQSMRPGEPYYEIIRKWIADGARIDRAAPRVANIDISPKDRIVRRTDGRQQYRVLATYTDGQIRDVTSEAFITSGNIEVATADSAGLVTVLRRGEAPVLARFEGKYAATTLTVMGERTGFVWKEPPANNFIDRLVAVKLRRTKTLPSQLCTDAEFNRRVSLDLTGLPPTADEVRKFLADSRDSRVKRNELIDRLVGGDDYVEHWTNKWADLLQVNRKYLGLEGAIGFRKWIRDSVAGNTPYDKFVYSILTATGSNRENPAASYFKIHRTPEDAMQNTTHLFLAVRFSCNKCHDHPFERWVQNQYWETAAFFARVGLKKDPASGKREIGKTAVQKGKPLYEIVSDKPEGEVRHDETGEITAPKFPYVVKYDAPPNASRREQIARWITSPDNQYFAKSYVNRVWGYLLGVSFIEPLDDIRAGNPPTNPELLDRLTQEFISGGFDVQHLIRTICKSRTYQMSIKTNKWNEDDTINYSHALARRLPAEVLYDALHRVTGSVSKFPGVPPGTRAAALPDTGVKESSGFLAKLGRPPRESACECERSSGMQFGPVIALVSGPTVSNAISDENNEITKLVASQEDDARLVDELFLRILSRPATQAETKASIALIRSLPAEHKKLVAERQVYEKSLAPKIAEQERQRQAAIATAKAELAAYEKEIAPREAQLDRQQKAKRVQLEADLKVYEKTLPVKLAAWEEDQKTSTVWTPLDPVELSATNGAKLTKEEDLSVFVSGKHGKGSYKFVAHTDLAGISGIRLELLADKRLPKNGPGRAKNGNFVLTEFRVESAPQAAPGKKMFVELGNALADFSQANFDVKKAIDRKQVPATNGWASAPKLGVDRTAVFEAKHNIGAEGGTLLTFWLDHKLPDGRHSIGRFRISVTTDTRPIRLDVLPENIETILAVAVEERDERQAAALMQYFRTVDVELKKRRQAVADIKKPRPIDPKLKQRRVAFQYASRPLPVDPKLKRLRHDVDLSAKLLKNQRLTAAQDIAWALINSPAFLFNR